MTELDRARQEAFADQVVGDIAAAVSGLLVHIGDRLGLYRAMAEAGPATPEVRWMAPGTSGRRSPATAR